MRQAKFTKSILALAMGGGLLVAVAAVSLRLRDDGIDWNPWVRYAQALQGEWTGDATVLSLGNGQFECEGELCREFGRSGTWRREGDFYVEFVAASVPPKLLRLGSKNHQLLLAAGAGPGDPDDWRPNVLLARRQRW